MFIDWLTMYQDHDTEQLPVITERCFHVIDTVTGEHIATSQPRLTHEGSFSSSISVLVSGNRVTISGNPSRYDRPDNLFGIDSIDKSVHVYNRILESLNLPPFTKTSNLFHLQGGQKEGTKHQKHRDGARITRIDVTTNISVGHGCVDDYIKGVSTQPYRHSVPRLHTDGKTCDWLSKQGHARLIYPKVYDKAYEMALHSLPKFKKKYGKESPETQYLERLIKHCEEEGIVRFELELHSDYLRRNDVNHWGTLTEEFLTEHIEQFTRIDERLQVTAMDLETVSEKLISNEVVETTRAANTTALYCLNWMHGQTYDLSKRQVQLHRSRLRKIGIDIARPCNITRFSPVTVKKATDVTPVKAVAPTWYKMPSHLKSVA